MLEVNGYTISLFINDLNFFDIPNARVSQIDIYEDIYVGLPTCTLELVFPKDAFNANAFVDGSIFKIGISSKDFGISGIYAFRVWDVPEITQTNSLVTVQANGVLDVYDMYYDANKYNLFANTSDIFQKICMSNSWSSEIDSTTDQQLWVAGRRNVFQFMHYLSKYGYVNDTSCMIWFFDKEQRLVYKDISNLFKTRSTVYTFTKNPSANDKSFYYNAASISLNAGTNNVNNGGYGYIFDIFDLLTYGHKNIHANKVTAVSNVINMSKELAQTLNYSRLAMDIGNFHENYYMAYAQNSRTRATYSTYITLTCQFLQKFRLGEIVNIEYQDTASKDEKNKAFSILAMINSIHTIITPEMVGAEVETMTQGLNKKSEQVETY